MAENKGNSREEKDKNRLNKKDNSAPSKAEEGTDLEISDSDFNKDPLGSGSGIIDLDIPADDTSLGNVLDEIYGGPGFGEGKKRVTRNFKALRYDEIMHKQRWGRVNDLYCDKYQAIAFIQKKDGKTKAYVMFGFSLKKFIDGLENIDGIECIGTETKDLNSALNHLKDTYLRGGSLRPMGIARDSSIDSPRVVLGYSTTYNPDGNIEKQIEAISKKARELTGIIREELNKAITGKPISKEPKGEDRIVRYIRGSRAVELYIGAYTQLGQKEPSLVQPEYALVDSAQMSAPPQNEKGNVGNKVVSLSGGAGKPISVTAVRPSALKRLYGATIGRLSLKKPKK